MSKAWGVRGGVWGTGWLMVVFFGAGCNVGYAFVNFITVQDLLHFATTQLGVKWYAARRFLCLLFPDW